MATLGLRGTGAFATNGTPGSSDQRPKNWREMMLMLFPNGEMPLTALLSKLASQGTDDPEFNWWEKGLPTQRTTVNNGAGYASGATSIVVADGSIFKAGHVVLVERTKEIIFVTVDPTANTLTVVRGKGEVAAAAMVDTDPLYVIGTVHEEGADSPNIVTYSPTKVFNYCQIFRTSLGQTRTAKKTRLRWDRTGPYREAKREALQLHGIEMEKAFMFGQRLEETGPNGMPRRTTRGVRTFITTNILTDANTDGTWTNSDLTSAWENIFRYGSSEKFGMAGSTAISVLTNYAKLNTNTTVNMVPTDQVYGMKITHIITPFGDLYLKNHPLMSDHPTYRKDMVVLDLPFLKYRYVDDTTFKKNVQAPGVDSSKDEFLTECGLEMWHEKAHALMTNLTAFSAT